MRINYIFFTKNRAIAQMDHSIKDQHMALGGHVFYAELEQKIIHWAAGAAEIRAAVLVGSRARQDHPADAWSDMDVLVFTTTPEDYLERLDWIEAFAPVWVSVRQQTAGGDPERLVVFDGGWQADFVVQNSAVLQALPQMLALGNIPDIIRRGARVLVDKDGCLAQLPGPSPVPLPPAPNTEQLAEFFERFWFEVIYASKQLGRGELVRYKSCEEGMRWRMLQLIEWHARAVRGADTWHAVRFLTDWADPAAYAAFTRSYTALEPQACLSALKELVSLFCRLLPETAQALNLEYPAEKMPVLRAYVEHLRV